MSINIENSKESSEKKLNQSQNDILHTLVTELHLLRKENIELKETNKELENSVVELKNKILNFEKSKKEEKKNVTITAVKKTVKPKVSADLSTENVLNKLDNEIRRYRYRDNYSI